MTFWGSVATLNPQKRPGFLQGVAVARAKQAVLPDLDTVVRQDVWQEPAEEFLGSARADLDCPGLGVLVLEGDLAICERAEAVVADRHTKDVGSQRVSGVRSTTDRFTMHHPVLFPEGVGDKVKPRGLAPRLAHVGTQPDGKRLDRHPEIFPGWEPLTALGSKSTCGHQVVPMGMLGHGASPGVQDPDHPELSADKPWIYGEVLEGLG
jgi:hypothetical protein